MPKGIFSQGFCLLTDGKVGVGDVKLALARAGCPVAKEPPDLGRWYFSGPSVVVPYLPAVNGNVAVDVVDRPWPDAMGDPKSDPMVFGAWGMGQFGPFTYPGGLARAKQHAWSWPGGRRAADAHRGFIRLRTSYAFGAGPDAKVLPKDYDPQGELNFLSRLTLALSAVPGVICYFNPNGEVLCDAAAFAGMLEDCEQKGLLPLPLWTNVRLFNVNPALTLMDTVGNAQLDLDDVEAIFPARAYDPNAVDGYLRNVTLHLIGLGRTMRTGETIDGPGERGLTWTIERLDDGLSAPPRPVVRLYPTARRDEVHAAVAGLKSAGR